jgi:hypothetical protein
MEGLKVHIEEVIQLEEDSNGKPSSAACLQQKEIKVDIFFRGQPSSFVCELPEKIKVEEDPYEHLSANSCVQQEEFKIEVDCNGQPTFSYVVQEEKSVVEDFNDQSSSAVCVKHRYEEAR